MLFAITLRYVRPKNEVEAHLDTHRQWLAAEIKAGRVLVAAPLSSGDGGFLLAVADVRDDIDEMLARDSFHVHGVASFEVAAFEPALRSAAFPVEWAPRAHVIA